MKGAQEVLDQLAKLRARQVSRGCTDAEQEAAARRIGELLMQYEELEIALPYRTQHRFHPPTPELWVPLAHILSASRAAIRRDGRTAWPLLVTRGWAKKMGLS